MSSDPLSFFTIDHGTASTAAAVIAPYGGRFRLLAAGAVPAGVEPEALLEDLVERVRAADPDAGADVEGWADWARLESVTSEPPAAVCVAGSERRAGELERALADGGWEVVARLVHGHVDAVSATESLLDRRVRLVMVGAADPPAGDERGGLAALLPLVLATVGRRSDVRLGLSGGVPLPADHGDDRLIRLPAPGGGGEGSPAPSLADALAELAVELAADDAGGRRLPDGRRSLRQATASLAALLDRRVESVDVGHSAATRTLAGPAGVAHHAVRADAALVPRAALYDDRVVDAILRWSPVRGDAFGLRDRVRNLRLAPWRDAAGDGARLRLAALRAALARLDASWSGEHARPGFFSSIGRDGAPADRAPADLVIVSGGALAVAPPPAVALALLDGLRRPGALTLFHDHARLLAPIGTLRDEPDRRRILADLMDDAFIPLGSAIVATGLRPGRHAGTLRLSSPLATTEHELVPGGLRSLDLPPGLTGTAELETREGVWLGVRTRHVALEVAGGLSGVLVDTRELPLRLPERGERRRALLESWERPLWLGGEA